MARCWILLILAGTSAAQQTPAPKPSVVDQAQLPPEEDKAQKPREYRFNPVQSQDEGREILRQER